MRTDGVPASLASHLVFAGRDLDDTREAVSSVINPHTLSLRDGAGRLDVRQFAAQVGDVTLSFLSYGAAVEIAAPATASCFCVHVPLIGNGQIRCGSRALFATQRMAAVSSPGEPLLLRWSAEAAYLVVCIERTVLERQLTALLGEPPQEPLRLELDRDLTDLPGQRWFSILDLLQAEIAQRQVAPPTSGQALDASAATVQELVMNALLLWHPNSYSVALGQPVAPALRPHVQRALEYAREHLDAPLTIASLAAAAGVSARTLQAGFARELGCAPSTYIRDLRLERVHAELAASDPADGVRVTDVALRWGFSHLGRFSSTYQRRFGELPSATLYGSRA
ncbi:MAG TPA: AraC family transcriptional regulator [Conexibacter sp.]|nr:AraC family transcriptional regulator [Conexibacter sp.]